MNRFHRWYCRSGHWRHELQHEVLPWALDGVPLGDDVLEVGPGPGLATDVLARRTSTLTALEIDDALAAALRQRYTGAPSGTPARVEVVTGSGTEMPFEGARFSAVVSFTMLHHVDSAEQQDRLLVEAHRVLRPGGWLCGTDSVTSVAFRLAHLADTMVLVDPETFPGRLEAAGFGSVEVRRGRRGFRFRGRKQEAD